MSQEKFSKLLKGTLFPTHPTPFFHVFSHTPVTRWSYHITLTGQPLDLGLSQLRCQISHGFQLHPRVVPLQPTSPSHHVMTFFAASVTSWRASCKHSALAAWHLGRWSYSQANFDHVTCRGTIMYISLFESFLFEYYKYILVVWRYLVGGWTNPFEKYDRQNGFIFPNFRDERKKYLSCHHPGMLSNYTTPNYVPLQAQRLVVFFHQALPRRLEEQFQRSSPCLSCKKSTKKHEETNPSPKKLTLDINFPEPKYKNNNISLPIQYQQKHNNILPTSPKKNV